MPPSISGGQRAAWAVQRASFRQLSAHAEAFRKLRSDSSGLCSRPMRELCAAAGMVIAYGAYSVQSGRRTAHGTGLGARVV